MHAKARKKQYGSIKLQQPNIQNGSSGWRAHKHGISKMGWQTCNQTNKRFGKARQMTHKPTPEGTGSFPVPAEPSTADQAQLEGEGIIL